MEQENIIIQSTLCSQMGFGFDLRQVPTHDEILFSHLEMAIIIVSFSQSCAQHCQATGKKDIIIIISSKDYTKFNSKKKNISWEIFTYLLWGRHCAKHFLHGLLCFHTNLWGEYYYNPILQMQ